MSAEEAKKVEQPTEAVKPEEVKPEEGEDDEPPGLEAVDAAAPETTQAPKQSRAERKVRKAMAKLGMKPVSGIMRVTIKRAKTTLFVIARPEVYKATGSDSYIAFGEIKVEDLSASAAALENARKAGESAAATEGVAAAEANPEAAAEPEAKKEEEKPAEPEEAVDETGLKKEDIDLVVQQAKCTRAKAVEALRKHNSDIVNTIMELTQ